MYARKLSARCKAISSSFSIFTTQNTHAEL
jgi:hypothetical protein